ncbi:hypothetical protein B0F90DRAFT_1824933 [Multifurca ochricompacta]|uniref:Nephrocystin 3-like N-terminal domain-containing protein n=1 Tax=Multifurca ochricompacta TaxID=376703 RepID=A0AAD4QEL1_9AGAM|nr:hypothetical protein B0F90DRAFT_1824933 [Multifurca ochricompacta]
MSISTRSFNLQHPQAAKDVVASHDTLVSLFERIQGFLERLKIYIDIPLTPQFTEVLGKVMAQVLLILAISTKTMTQRRIKKYLKRLVGRTDVEDAMNRLDMLTQEETRMAAIKEIAHDVDGNLKAIKKVTHDVDRNVKVINEVVRDVGNDTKAIKEATHSVSDDVKMIKKETEQLRSTEKLRAWLSPPNPSINHNVARDTREWFHVVDSRKPGSGKSILWYAALQLSKFWVFTFSTSSTIIEDIEGLQASGKALMAYYYFDFKDMAKRDVRGLLSSLLIQLCDYSEDCWSVLSRLYALHRDGSNQPNEATLAHCLRDMLELPGQLKVYLIMDALDECPNTTGFPSPREKVLGLVEGLVKQQHPNLYVCVTSRPEQDIRAVLEP